MQELVQRARTDYPRRSFSRQGTTYLIKGIAGRSRPELDVVGMIIQTH